MSKTVAISSLSELYIENSKISTKKVFKNLLWIQ